jgi:hypothetical protein
MRINSLRSISDRFGDHDVLVVFGEIFDAGYANGVVREALRRGMKVIYSTVGRRDGVVLRVLDSNELEQKRASPIINIPLEAGFDHEEHDGKSVVSILDHAGDMSIDELKFDWEWVDKVRRAGRARFVQSVERFMFELEEMIPPQSNCLFLHTMAGGIPRSSFMHSILLKLFRPQSADFLSSERFFSSDLGRLCEISFQEVSAESYRLMIELSHKLRRRLESRGNRVSYAAFGYLGNEVFFRGQYRWQALGFYIQAKAKLKLTEFSKESFAAGISSTVFNVPECITSSSKTFPGIELPILLLVSALRNESKEKEKYKSLEEAIGRFLLPNVSVTEFVSKIDVHYSALIGTKWTDPSAWPQQSDSNIMSQFSDWSRVHRSMQSGGPNALPLFLSEIIVDAVGKIVLGQSWDSNQPELWIGHDVVAKMHWNTQV